MKFYDLLHIGPVSSFFDSAYNKLSTNVIRYCEFDEVLCEMLLISQ